MNAEPNSVSDYFDENGFYLARKVYSEASLVSMEHDFDRIVSQLRESGQEINARWDSSSTDEIDGGDTEVIHTHNVHRFSSRWLAALQENRFLDIAEQILGPDIVLHHSKLFKKPPERGAPFPIHQDWWYFPTKKDSMIAAVIFLGDTDDSTGGFRVYPGSHKLGKSEGTSGLVESELLNSYPIEDATPIEARRGDVLFFSYFTLHGSMPNRSNKDRKTVLVQMYSGDDYVLPNDDVNHVDECLMLRGWNHKMSRERAAR